VLTERISEVPGKRSRCSTQHVQLTEPGDDAVPTGRHWGRQLLRYAQSSASAGGPQALGLRRFAPRPSGTNPAGDANSNLLISNGFTLPHG
jgi:hypothetical protein